MMTALFTSWLAPIRSRKSSRVPLRPTVIPNKNPMVQSIFKIIVLDVASLLDGIALDLSITYVKSTVLYRIN